MPSHHDRATQQPAAAQNVLIVRTSSMGDLVHTLPAITELKAHHPHLRISWLTEAAFADIPALHPGISEVIPIAWRQWRRQLLHRRGPHTCIKDAAALMGHAAAVIGVDTGLTHLANALNVPLVALYTDTDPAQTGVVESPRAMNLGNVAQCPTVDNVWHALRTVQGEWHDA
ncbi:MULTISPECIES: glycosyltransferase family 9 protein [unclassified Cupriavidus]|uniref:glycosyltransferase family 9 protein n=1 Tax=unclassified Cupriavidus TaxID=2640874 RepID=UPI00313B697E